MPKDHREAAARPVQADFRGQFRVCYNVKCMSCDLQGLRIHRQILYRNVEGLLPLFSVHKGEHTDDASRIIIQPCILLMSFWQENNSTFQQYLKCSLFHSQSPCQSPPIADDGSISKADQTPWVRGDRFLVVHSFYSCFHGSLLILMIKLWQCYRRLIHICWSYCCHGMLFVKWKILLERELD